MSTVDDVAAAVEAGELVVIPTDTVYGLACRPDREDAVRALSTLKQRSPDQPIALVASGVEPLRELIPELPVDDLLARRVHSRRLRTRRIACPGSAAPAETIGVRIPEVDRSRRRAPRARRRRRGHECEPARRRGSAARGRHPGGDPRRRRRSPRRGRSPRHAVDRGRPDRSGAAGAPRRRGPRGRGSGPDRGHARGLTCDRGREAAVLQGSSRDRNLARARFRSADN